MDVELAQGRTYHTGQRRLLRRQVPTVSSLLGSFLSPKISPFLSLFMHLFLSLVSVLSCLGFSVSVSLILRIPHVFPNLFSDCRTLTPLLDTLVFSPLLRRLWSLIFTSPLSSSPDRLVGFLVCRRGSIPRRTQPFHGPSRGYRLCLVSLRRSSRGTSMQRDLKLRSLRGLLSAGLFGRVLLWLGMQLCSGGSRWDSFVGY